MNASSRFVDIQSQRIEGTLFKRVSQEILRQRLRKTGLLFAIRF